MQTIGLPTSARESCYGLVYYDCVETLSITPMRRILFRDVINTDVALLQLPLVEFPETYATIPGKRLMNVERSLVVNNEIKRGKNN